MSNRVIDWQKISKQIVENLGDQGKITQILADLEPEITTFNTRFADNEKKLGEYEGQISSLQKTNMELFLRVGNKVPDEAVRDTKPLAYEDLFDENGGLK